MPLNLAFHFKFNKSPGFLVMFVFRRCIPGENGFIFPFSMHSSDFRMISRNLTRKYVLSSDYFSAQGPSRLNPVHDDNCDFDSVTCATFKVIPRAHTPSRARAAYTHFSAFICVHALPPLIPAPSFSCARCHSCALIRVRALARPTSSPSFARARCHNTLWRLDSCAPAASAYSGALIRVSALPQHTPAP